VAEFARLNQELGQFCHPADLRAALLAADLMLVGLLLLKPAAAVSMLLLRQYLLAARYFV